jgi:hypothetical protein
MIFIDILWMLTIDFKLCEYLLINEELFLKINMFPYIFSHQRSFLHFNICIRY